MMTATRLKKIMIIKRVAREGCVQSECACIDGYKSQIPDHTTPLLETRFPHIFEDSTCDEKVTRSIRKSAGKYQL